MPGTGYSKLQKGFHRITLGSKTISELSFDLEQTLLGDKISAEVSDGKHLFITGLARSGTTTLLTSLYNTKAFASLTYEEMPFILAPNLKGKISFGHKSGIPKERAHADGIFIDNESPEALDEVFWKVLLNDNYITRDRLLINEVPQEILLKYRKYIDSILFKKYQGSKIRYLSKNNNNILRLHSIIDLFPGATVVIPFRDPLQHARSLLHQHKNFCSIHKRNAFSLSYMNWLGHHEFGLNQKPFFLNNHAIFDKMLCLEKDNINFWLLSWLNYYSYVLDNFANSCLLFSYERFCKDPNEALQQLWSHLEIQEFHFNLTPFALNFRTSSNVDSDILNQCLNIYDRLNKTAL
jgi:hypothetical protein